MQHIVTISTKKLLLIQSFLLVVGYARDRQTAVIISLLLKHNMQPFISRSEPCPSLYMKKMHATTALEAAWFTIITDYMASIFLPDFVI